MAGRIAKPWFRAARNEWYVTIKTVKYRLGPDKEEATREFHRLMSGTDAEPKEQGREWLYASEVADQFQIALKEERASSTVDWYCQYLDPFKVRFMESRADTLSVDAIREWINGKWKSQPSRRAASRAVKAAFRRAVNDGRLQSPIAAMKLPGETARDYVVKPAEYRKVLAAVKDKSFADLIRFVWITGARPQEAVLIEDVHVELKQSRVVLPPKQTKGKKRPRVIYLSPDALKLVKKNMGKGLIFRTARGSAFNKDLVRQRFETLEKTLGFRYCLYHFRHGFAHRSLAAGNDALTVSTLLGHSSTQTLARVYSHLNQADSHLRAALRKTK